MIITIEESQNKEFEELKQRVEVLECELNLIKSEREKSPNVHGTITITKDKIVVTDAKIIVDSLEIGKHKIISVQDKNSIVLYN